jgi:hypothetical protein
LPTAGETLRNGAFSAIVWSALQQRTQQSSQLETFSKVPLSHPSHPRCFLHGKWMSSSCRALEEGGCLDVDPPLSTKPSTSNGRTGGIRSKDKTRGSLRRTRSRRLPSQLSSDAVSVGRPQNNTWPCSTCVHRRRAAASVAGAPAAPATMCAYKSTKP